MRRRRSQRQPCLTRQLTGGPREETSRERGVLLPHCAVEVILELKKQQTKKTPGTRIQSESILQVPWSRTYRICQ